MDYKTLMSKPVLGASKSNKKSDKKDKATHAKKYRGTKKS